MDPAHERTATIERLDAGVSRLLGAMNPDLVPGEGCAFGFALKGARDAGSIASVPGGIRKCDGALRADGPCRFGTGDAATRAILTALRFDPLMRSAAVLQFSERTLAVLEDDLFLACASFSSAQVRGGISTMDWGIAFCCKEDVPDVVYEQKADMSTSRLILFGEGPDDVANNIIICSGRI
jgi:hydroxymethylpyrimidine/phosphomethylpyrimidine kinase